MEGRPSRGRGGGWRRGGRGGHDGESFGGERRGRGGHHHGGRGKRDHYRGRGRGRGGGCGGHVEEFHHRDQEAGADFQEDDDKMESFSWRTLESNRDRYKESEQPEPTDETPTQRGTDYHIMLESAGDSFTQFRFSEEKDWEKDSFAASQLSEVFVDVRALAQILQGVPLHQRLNLEAELLQDSAPAELPTITVAPQQEIPKTPKFTPPPAASKGPSSSTSTDSRISSRAAETAVEDADEELDQLLSLDKPISASDEPVSEKIVLLERVREEVTVTDDKLEEVTEKMVESPKPASVRPELTEEDLEDWLDSMIS